jgi:hypothetical protein
MTRKRGSIALARQLCYEIAGATSEDDDINGSDYGSVDVAEILSAEVERLREALARDHAMHDLARLGQEIEQEPDRRVLQAAGTHPAPCARHCEAKAFEIEIRSLNSRLKQAQPQLEQEPTCPECKAGVLYECVACSSNNYPPKPQPPPEWEAIKNIIAEYGLQAIDFVADWKATLGQAEPVAWGVFEGNLHDMFFSQSEAKEMAALKGTHAEVRPLYAAPPAAQPKQEPVAYYHPRNGFYWAKPTSIFAPTSVDVEPLPLYAAVERNNG